MNSLVIILLSTTSFLGALFDSESAQANLYSEPKELVYDTLYESELYEKAINYESETDTSELVLQKTVDNTSPIPGEVFTYTIDVACNSTSRDCESVILTDCLDPDVSFVHVSEPLPDGVKSADYDPVTHCVTIEFDATNCTSCNPDGINTDEDDFAQGSSIQLLIEVLFPIGTFEGTTSENTINATTDNAGNPSSTADIVTVLGGSPIYTGCDAIPSYADIAGALIPGAEWQGRVRATNQSPTEIDDYVITTTLPQDITFTHIIGPDLESGLCTDIDVYYERSDMPGTFTFHTTINSCSSQLITAADLGLPAGVKPTAFRFDYGTLEGDGSWNPDSWTTIHENEIRVFGSIDANIPIGTPLGYCNTVEGTVDGEVCTDTECDSQNVLDQTNDAIDGSKKIFDDADGFAVGDTYRVGLTYTSPVAMQADVEGAYLLDILPDCMEYVPGSWFIAWGETNINNQDPVVNTGYTPEGRQFVEFVWDETLGNNFVIPPNGLWVSFQVRFDVVITGSCVAGEYLNDYYYATTGNDVTTDCASDVPFTNLTEFANADTYVTNGELCYDPETLEVIVPPGSAGLDSHKASKGSLDTDFVQFPNSGDTYAGGVTEYRICLDNPNPVPVDNIVIIDIFPHPGDSEILNPEVPRGSDWIPSLTEPIMVPAGYTVEYTTVTNPCRDELAGPTDPLPFPTGCNPPAWSTTPPGDLTTVTGVRIDYGSTTLNQGEQVCLEWSMNIPDDAASGSTAFNSFAFIATNGISGASLLSAEPIKVGVGISNPPCAVFEVNPGPIASFCEGETGNLVADTEFGVEPFSYSWTGPNGFSSSDTSPTVTEGGSYMLTITDDTGCMVTTQMEVFTFPCDETSPCHFLHAFNSSSYFGSDGTESWSDYSWDETGDDNSANGGDVMVIGGVLHMSNASNNQPSIQRRINLEEHSSAILSLDVDLQGSLDADDTFIIEVYDGTTWHTIFSYNGASGGTMPWFDISAYISANTEIRISITSGFDSAGESITIDNVRIDADCLCDAEILTMDQDLCVGSDLQLNTQANGSGVLAYNWSPAVGLDDASASDPIASPLTTTSYTVTVTDEFGCTATDELTITVIDTTEIFCQRYAIRDEDNVWGPWINFNGDCTIELCALNGLQDIRFDAGPDINTGWVWTDEDGNIDPEVDEIVVFGNIGLNDAGTYTGILTSANGCTSTINFEVIVNENVQANATVLAHDYCISGSGELTVSITEGMGPFTINWQNDAGGEQGTTTVDDLGDLIISNLNAGTTYCVEITDSAGCVINP